MSTDERTIYDVDRKNSAVDGEKTIYDEPAGAGQGANSPKLDSRNVPSSNPSRKKKGGKGWAGAAAGLVGGALMGSATTLYAKDHVTIETESDNKEEDDSKISDTEEEANIPAWTDGEVKVATNVSDSMSFGEAFQAARDEVGAGGAFEWRGQVYGTYLESEWNQMSSAERAAYGSHFEWSNYHADGQQVGDTQEDEPEVQVLGVAEGEMEGQTIPVIPEGENVIIDVNTIDEPRAFGGIAFEPIPETGVDEDPTLDGIMDC